jgi:hypothetical protein
MIESGMAVGSEFMWLFWILLIIVIVWVVKAFADNAKQLSEK